MINTFNSALALSKKENENNEKRGENRDEMLLMIEEKVSKLNTFQNINFFE